jgi:tight adherence protein B
VLPDDRGRATVLLAILLAAALCVVVPGPARAVDVTGTIDGLQLRDGRVELVLTTADLPVGSDVDLSSARVRIGGREVATTASVAGGTLVERRLVMLVDVSGSMRGAGIDAAKAAATDLVSRVAPDVMVGLVAFNDVATVVAAPTTDRQVVLAAVQSLEASRETALYDGVTSALATLGSGGDRTLVVLSDGGDTVSRTTLGVVTQQLATSGVKAEVVGFRTDESQGSVLAGLAAAGRGTVTTTDDAAGIARAFQGVARSLSTQLLMTAEVPEGLTGVQEVVVSLRAGPDTVTAASTLALPETVPTDPGEAVPLAPRGLLAAAVPAWLATPWPAAAAVGLLVLLLGLLTLRPMMRRRTPTRLQQLEYYGLSARRVPVRLDKAQQSSALAQPVLDAAETFVRRRGLERGMALVLDRADMPWRPHEYLVLRCAAALSATALAVVLTDGWLLAVVAPFAGWFVVTGYVHWRARRRTRVFAAQLPDALALVASSLKTGFSLNQALEAVGQDMSEPLKGQVARAVAEARLGADLEDCLDQIAHRMRCEDLAWTVMAIRIQRQVGGNLAETLRTTTVTLRERASLRRHVKALSADGRMSAYVLVALPIVVVLGLRFIAPDYISLLWSNPVGLLAAAVAVIGMVIGSLWMRSLVRVEL